MRISDVAAASGLSIEAIRYYERSGLCPPIPRGSDGNRVFTTESRDWLILLASLRDTGMPTRQMRHFATLYRAGNATVPERRRILLDHDARLDERQKALEDCRRLLAFKLKRYDEISAEVTP